MTPLDTDEIADLLRARMRAEAEAAAQEASSPRAALRRTTLAFLFLVDGTDPLMPSFHLMPMPHPDDEELARKEGLSWFDEEIVAGGLEAAFREAASCEAWDAPSGAPGRAWTPEEVRSMLLRVLRGNEDVWAGASRPLEACCEGLAFSAFATVDGSVPAIPGCDWFFDADAGLNERRGDAGLRPFPERGVISTELHDGFHDAVSPDAPEVAGVAGPSA
jgi:hypothetical protein